MSAKAASASGPVMPGAGVRAFQEVGTSRAARALSSVLATFFLVAAVALVVTPWQQNVPGKGRVVAFSPVERSQPIQAPVDGRVMRWEVVEGSRVRRGDVLAEMADNDPEILRRITDERIAVSGTLEAALRKGEAVERKIGQILATREQALASLRARIESASQKVRAAEQALIAAEAAHVTAKLNIDRQHLLAGKGLASTRMVELAQLEFDRTAADVDRARAGLEAERNDRLAVEAEYERVNADYAAKIEEGRGEAATALSDAEKARAELMKVDVRLARQATQLVRAPADGTILRVLARAGGDMLKQGATIAILVPESAELVAELWVDGNDVPLLSKGRKARLQFEGWPALQFTGWPSVAVGTFGGRVLLIDPADNGRGEFRILIEPDPDDEPWPDGRFLRQGALANGWVLLDTVRLGYELWRQFNGFPPSIGMTAPDYDPMGGADAK